MHESWQWRLKLMHRIPVYSWWIVANSAAPAIRSRGIPRPTKTTLEVNGIIQACNHEYTATYAQGLSGGTISKIPDSILPYYSESLPKGRSPGALRYVYLQQPNIILNFILWDEANSTCGCTRIEKVIWQMRAELGGCVGWLLTGLKTAYRFFRVLAHALAQ